VITDAQNEFITGALGNKECEAAVKYIVAAAESGEYYKVIFTKDTHTADYLHTQEGKRLPVLHGQEGTEGYKIHPDIVKAVQEHYAPEQILTVKKPTFGSLDFGNTLKAVWEEVTAAGEAAEGEYSMEVDFTGFCTGICVLSNVVMAKAFVPEARVCVIEKACACVTPQTHQTAIAAMGPIQADVI
jgi:nicotinamidase/pyrazinamidase